MVAVKALACELPSRLGVPLSRWHMPDLAAEAAQRGTEAQISDATIWRWLSKDAIKAPAGALMDLPPRPGLRPRQGPYAREWQGKPLGDDDDEDLYPGPHPPPSHAEPSGGPGMRLEHEYQRGGALAYLAGWDVHRGQDLRPVRAHQESSPSNSSPLKS